METAITPQIPPMEFTLLEFNRRRNMRGVRAARVQVIDGENPPYWLWMSASEIRLNMKEHGAHPELQRALDIYAGRAAA